MSHIWHLCPECLFELDVLHVLEASCLFLLLHDVFFVLIEMKFKSDGQPSPRLLNLLT